MTLLPDSAHFTDEGRRLLAAMGWIDRDPLRVVAERWLLDHKGPDTEATRAAVTPCSRFQAPNCSRSPTR